MKKILHKVLKRSNKPPETGGRITNETVAEHRERVLAGGRKFKYPLQYTKRRVLTVSIVLSVLALLFFIAFSGWNLYILQSYDRFTYGLTQIVPVPVAQVDGESVRYSDYLSKLRSSVHYLTTKEAINFSSADGQRQLEYLKRVTLDESIGDAYIAKLALQHNITISDKEVDDFAKKQIASNKLGVSEEIYRQVISDYYDWTIDEYKKSVRQQLLNKKVSATIDTTSKEKIQALLQQIAAGVDFATIAKDHSEDQQSKGQGGDVGFVSKNSEDPNGLIAVASALQPGQVSQVIEGADGFYIVRLLEKRDTGDVHFAKIFVAYKAVAQQLADFKKQNKITEYIKVDPITDPLNQ